jgi:hypothetical protein
MVEVLKNIGDCILFYFLKTSIINNTNSFQIAIACDFKILEERYKINDVLCLYSYLVLFLWLIRYTHLNIKFIISQEFYALVY